MNEEVISRMSIDHRPWYVMSENWFVNVCQHKFIRLRDEVIGVQVFAVDKCRKPTGVDLHEGDRAVFMAMIPHTIAPISFRGYNMRVRIDRAVVWDLFDLEIDISYGHDVSLQ
jgi:hypothetical protein